jgi:hypothetical protein
MKLEIQLQAYYTMYALEKYGCNVLIDLHSYLVDFFFFIHYYSFSPFVSSFYPKRSKYQIQNKISVGSVISFTKHGVFNIECGAHLALRT